MPLTNQQKGGVKSLIGAIGVIILLIGVFTEWYRVEIGLLIALAIWILMNPLLKIFGFEVKKEEAPMPSEGGEGKSGKRTFWSIGQIVLIVILVVVVVLWGLSYVWGRGSGNVIEQTREVSDFSKVSLSGQGNLYITQGSEEGLRIQGEDNIIDKIRTTVSGGKLNIDYRKSWFVWNIWPTEEVNFYLAVKDLEDIHISGSGKIFTDSLKTKSLSIDISGSGEAEMNLEAEELDTQISGSGKFTLEGTADTNIINVSGSGTFLTKELKTKKADVTISGSGKAEVWATEELDINISGSGTVKYKGAPKVTQSISGSGKVEILEAEEVNSEEE